MAVELQIAPQHLEAADPEVVEAMLDYLEERAKEAQREGLLQKMRGSSWP